MKYEIELNQTELTMLSRIADALEGIHTALDAINARQEWHDDDEIRKVERKARPY